VVPEALDAIDEAREAKSDHSRGPAAERGIIPRIEQQSEDKMKPPVAVLALSYAVVMLYPSSGFSQQQTGLATSPAATTTNTSSQQTQPFAPFSPPPSATIRVTGTPTIQPSPGLRQECTPVEQEIAGLIVGPTDLCDR
jgi:hypothetical protein